MEEKYINDKQLSEILNVPKRTLQRLRRQGEGPPCVKLGKNVLYRVADVERFLAENRMQHGTMVKAG